MDDCDGRRPLADCTNSLKSVDSSSSSSVSLLKKPQLPSHSCIPLAGDGVGAGAAGGAQKSAAHHGGRHAVKRKYPTAAVMTTAVTIGDSSGNINQVKDCEVSRSIILPDKRVDDEGVIFVEELEDDVEHMEESRLGGRHVARIWGLVVHGTGGKRGPPVCYLMKTSRVGTGVWLTHFYLVRVNGFRESARSHRMNLCLCDH